MECQRLLNKQSLLFYPKEGGVTILYYVLLGIVIYILVLPVLEELATVIVQALEILKGKAMVIAQRVQNELLELSSTNKEEEEKQITHVIGFQLPEEPEEYEDDEEDWDEDE